MIQVGNWAYHEDTADLQYVPSGAPHIDVGRLTTSAEVLDVIMQQESKPYFTADEIGDLVRILNLLLEPQATLCSGGKHKPLADPVAKANSRVGEVSPRAFVSRSEDPEHLKHVRGRGH
jgi:hypothetical protein